MPTAMKKRPFQPDDFYALRRPFDPQVSPDGKHVAYAVMSTDKAANERLIAIWMAPMDGRTPARRFSWGKHDHTPRWSPDGRSLAFVSDRNERNQVFIAPLDGGDPRQLTHEKHGVNEIAWSPDGTRVAYTARTGEYKSSKEKNPAERVAPRVVRNLRYRLDGIGYFDERRLHIFVADVESGTTKQITDGDWYDQNIAWSPDGKTIAFVSDREKQRHDRQFRNDLWTVLAAGGKARRITRGRGSAAAPLFSPNGRWIAFSGHENRDEMAQQGHLYIVPAKGGALRSVSESIDRQPLTGIGSTIAWSPDSKAVYFIAADGGAWPVYRAPIGAGGVTKAIAGQRQIQMFSLAPDGKRAAVLAAFTSNAPEIYATTVGNGVRERNLSHANDDLLTRADIATTKRMTSKAADGVATESYVLYPPGYKAGTRYPLLLDVHGGPHGGHPGSGFNVQAQAWACAGYIVLLPNPRGSSGYGEAFQLACVNDWGGGDYEDLMASVDALLKKGVADPDRLYVSGYSYGGFMTTWIVGHTQRFKAALIGAPVANHLSMVGTSDIPHFSQYELGGTQHDNREEWVGRSPLTYLPNCTTPVLIEHHENDLRCPIGQAEEIFAALKLAGKEVEFLRYPGGFHGFDSHAPSQTVDVLQRSIAWFDSHGGKPKTKATAAKKQRRVKASANGTSANGSRAKPAQRKTTVPA